MKEYKKKKQGAEEENFFLLFSSFYFSFLFQILLSFFSLFVFVFGRFIEWLAARGSVKKKRLINGKKNESEKNLKNKNTKQNFGDAILSPRSRESRTNLMGKKKSEK